MNLKAGTWVAMDAAGTWWAFAKKPWLGKQHWTTDGDMTFIDKRFFDVPIPKNWMESLFQVDSRELATVEG